MQQPKSGPNSTAEYQISGLPYATASSVGSAAVGAIEFPYVTNTVVVKNNGSGYLAIGFSWNGVQGTNRFTLPPSSSFSEKLRLKTLYFSGLGGTANFEVVAGLTMVDTNMFPVLTASGGVGVAVTGSNLNIFGYNGIG